MYKNHGCFARISFCLGVINAHFNSCPLFLAAAANLLKKNLLLLLLVWEAFLRTLANY